MSTPYQSQQNIRAVLEYDYAIPGLTENNGKDAVTDKRNPLGLQVRFRDMSEPQKKYVEQIFASPEFLSYGDKVQYYGRKIIGKSFTEPGVYIENEILDEIARRLVEEDKMSFIVGNITINNTYDDLASQVVAQKSIEITQEGRSRLELDPIKTPSHPKLHAKTASVEVNHLQKSLNLI